MIQQLSLFFPCYNEEATVARVVRECLEAAAQVSVTCEVIVVDDGSTDRTGLIARRLAATDERVRLVRHPRNRGYGAALQSGFRAARYPFIFYTDGDGQFDIGQLLGFLPLPDDCDVLSGYRVRRSDGVLRTMCSRCYGALLRGLLGLTVRDANCAFKIYRRRVIETITLTCQGAAIDAEMLLKAQRAGFHIKQVAVRHFPRRTGRSSGLAPGVILRALRETWRLRRSLAGPRR